MSSIDDQMFEGLSTQSRDAIAAEWGWLLALGILTLIAGVLAIIAPRVAAIAAELVIGAVLLADGVFRGVQAYRLRRWPGSGFRIVSCLLSLFLGIALLAFPITGVITLALLIGIYFIVGGVVNAIMAYQVRHQWGTSGLIVTALLSLVLGLIVLVVWPELAPTVLGILVGVHLVVAGVWLIAMGMAARKWIAI